MSNPSKRKGTASESEVVKYVQSHGFPWASRLALAGANDCGDISLLPGRLVILEVKNHQGQPSLGQPSANQLATWMVQTGKERAHAGAHYGLLVVKRSGTTDVGRWFCYLRMCDLGELTRAKDDLPDTPVCMPFAAALELLIAAGYGGPTTVAA